jgi:7-carboxy-7-deazaguanine synthase
MDAELGNAVLKVNEIFYSIQGESTQAGRPCVFVRLTYCNLRCSYCDTRYAYNEGQEMTIAEILDRVKAYECPLIEITGGEPLVQENSLLLMKTLCDQGFQVMLETGGSLEISWVDRRVKKIVDFKCPSSGETEKNRFENIQFLNLDDEVKFVVGDRGDYEWAREIIRKYALSEKSTVLISTVFGAVDLQKLVSWILQDHLQVRLQLQLHKIIWPRETRGV